MKLKSGLIMFMLFGIALSGCGKEGSSKKTASTPAPGPLAGAQGGVIQGLYTYMFHDMAGNCSTGRQSFNNLEEFCKVILDDSRNGNCARFQRESEHLTRCQIRPPSQPTTPGPTNPNFPQQVDSGIRNVFCSVAGKDYSNQLSSFLNQRSYFRTFTWLGKKQSSHRLSFMAGQRYGDAKVTFSPRKGAQKEGTTTITLRNPGRAQYSVSGSVSHSTRLMVDDAQQEATSILDCASLSSQMIAQAPMNIQKVTCAVTYRGAGGTKTDDLSIPWNGQTIFQTNLGLTGSNQQTEFELRLLPAAAPDYAMVEIEGMNPDTQKQVYARGSLRTGFSFSYQDSRERARTQVNCSLN